jgi:putative spermidine/putrescine transport system ATP-binding protein
MLDIRDIAKSFAGAPALTAATLTVDHGELVCLLGPSGCGKSTLLRLISGLTAPDAGRIAIAGADVTALAANRRPTAMVFQSHALWSHMTVARNVGFGLRVRGLPKDDIAARVDAALALVGLAGFGRRLPQELSGGQAQRVALARAVLLSPKVVLADEPTASLDDEAAASAVQMLVQTARQFGATLVIATHDGRVAPLVQPGPDGQAGFSSLRLQRHTAGAVA